MCRDQSMQLCLFHAAKIDKHVTTNKLFEFLFALTENILTYIKTPYLHISFLNIFEISFCKYQQSTAHTPLFLIYLVDLSPLPPLFDLILVILPQY